MCLSRFVFCFVFVVFFFFWVCFSSNFSFLVPFREPPRYKPGRRGSRKSYYGEQRVETTGRLPSPSLSLRSLCPFSSASSSLSETSSASGGSNSASYISNNTGKRFFFRNDFRSGRGGFVTRGWKIWDFRVRPNGRNRRLHWLNPGRQGVTQSFVIELKDQTARRNSKHVGRLASSRPRTWFLCNKNSKLVE